MAHENFDVSFGTRLRCALLAALCAIAAFVAAGCGGAYPQPDTAPGAEGADRPGEAEDTEAAADTAAARDGYVPADADFTRDMIVHHAQALEMTALAPDNAGSEDIRLLARRIEQTQEYEIDLMRRWLDERGEPLPEEDLGPHGGHEGGAEGGHAGMAGMASPEEMAALTEAEGAAFDRMFLELMIRHHEGALVMLDELDEHEGAGNEPELFLLLSHIDADQRAEIARMRQMLEPMD